MKNKTLLILILFFVLFCFVVFFKGLKVPNVYIPETILNKDIITFNSKNLFTSEQVLSDEVFVDNEFLSVDSLAFRKHLMDITPDVDMDAKIIDSTGKETEVAIPVTVRFFWPES